MPFWCYMHMLLFGKKEDNWPPESSQSNTVIKSLGSWRQSICPLRFQSPTVKDTKNGAQKRHEGIKQLKTAKRAALQNNDLIGVATLVPQTNLSETTSYTEAETLKAKSEGFQDHLGWFQKEGVIFLLGNRQWKLVNSLHATTHLGEKALQRLLERSFRGLQMTIRQVVSSCPTCQLNNPQGARRPQLIQPVQQRGTYPEEDWQMDFTQMPVSQGYKYLLVMIDTFAGWIEGFPTQAEKAKEVVKKKKCSMKSFWDFVCRGHYKMTMGHLLLRSLKGSLKHWAFLIISIVPGGLSLQGK